jgi:MFS family permease
MFKQKLFDFPQLNPKIWLLAFGRLLSQIGTGFTLFYAPIFFVNEVGLSATLVGIALGSASISGVLGRFIAGSLADSPNWGRKKTLLISAAVSALADIFLALTFDFPTLVLGNLLMGLGIGLYWPANEAMVADLTTDSRRSEAFAICRLADSLGLGMGVILGGILIATSLNYRLLFVIDGISFVAFFAVIYFLIKETFNQEKGTHKSSEGWLIAFKDRRLMIYVLANILFTTYIAQIQSTLPLYLKNFVSNNGFSPTTISALFTYHIIIASLLQLPIARWLNSFTRIKALKFSLLCWGIGFIFVGLTGWLNFAPLIWAIIALGILAIATISYTPSASSLVVEIAPVSLRGIYLSINSQCWAIGYLIGPPLGGWALDQSTDFAHNFWLFCALTIGLGIAILTYLKNLLIIESP